jgi:hypothetical protein
MGKSSGNIRSSGQGKGGADGGDISNKGTKLSNKGSLNEITNRGLKRDIQQAISKYESRLGIRTTNVGLADMGNSNGIMQTVNGKVEGVWLNRALYANGTKETIGKAKEDAYKTGWSTKTNSPVQHTIVHELGHATWNSHLTGKNHIQASVGIKALFKQFKQEYIGDYKGSGGVRGMQKSYGSYSTRNVNEFFAEVTAKAVLGKPDKYTKKIKTIITNFKL